MIKKKVGDADQIFGSVTGADVVAAIEQQVRLRKWGTRQGGEAVP